MCLSTKGFGGRIASGSSLGAYVRKITAMEKVDKEDPRDAVLKYAKVSLVIFQVHATIEFTNTAGS